MLEGMDRLIWIVTVLFAVLNIYGAGVRVREPQFRAPCLVLIGGGLLLLAAVGASLKELFWDWAIALAGCALICAAAYWNGRRCGVIHFKHHAVRISFCLLLVLGLYLF